MKNEDCGVEVWGVYIRRGGGERDRGSGGEGLRRWWEWVEAMRRVVFEFVMERREEGDGGCLSDRVLHSYNQFFFYFLKK